VALAGATVGGGVWYAARRPTDRPGPATAGPVARPGPASDSDAVSDAPPSLGAPPALHATEDARALAGAVEDRKDEATAVAALARKIDSGQPIGPGDLRVAEELYARYPDEARRLLEAALVAAAFQHERARRYAEARDLLERAVGVAPGSLDARRGLMSVLADIGDWPGVESAARAVLGLLPEDGGATKALAYAMVRQDRTREAIETLAAYLSAHPDAEAAAMLDKLRREHAAEGGFEEQRLAHFHVRYDGEAHEDVGREILRVLDRHYATLRVAFDHEPPGPIPVILFSTQSYYDATGAPAWSGGEYDHFDARIRVPIGGLTASLSPELESTLLHELTHAFVTDLSGGVAPREVQEGLAQWTEGLRSETMLGDRGLRALADGRIRGVTGFYLASLVLVEDLVAQRGRSGINDVLAAMNRTRDVDAAFREVYGRSFQALEAETVAKLRQRHAS
jgi:tetratricopeptide (TPR) repeat protein